MTSTLPLCRHFLRSLQFSPLLSLSLSLCLSRSFFLSPCRQINGIHEFTFREVSLSTRGSPPDLLYDELKLIIIIRTLVIEYVQRYARERGLRSMAGRGREGGSSAKLLRMTKRYKSGGGQFSELKARDARIGSRASFCADDFLTLLVTLRSAAIFCPFCPTFSLSLSLSLALLVAVVAESAERSS